MAGELLSSEANKSRNNMASSSVGGFCYSYDVSSNNPTTTHFTTSQIQDFGSNPAEIFNLTTGMEMIGFPKQQNDTSNPAASSIWNKAGFFGKQQQQQPDFTTGISESSTDHHHQNNLLVGVLGFKKTSLLWRCLSHK